MSKWLVDEEEIEAIESSKNEEGMITPELVLETASDESSPIHHRFEWENGKAAHEYRLMQGRQLIRKVVQFQVIDGATIQTPKYYNVKCVDDSNKKISQGYVEYTVVKDTPIYKAQILKEVIMEIRRWQNIKEVFTEVNAIINDDEVGKLEKEYA